VSGLPLEPVPDPAAVLALCTAKALHLEGIAMVLGLEDVSGEPSAPGPAGPARETLALGEVLADRTAAYLRALRPDAAEDDYWAVHDALVVVAEAHGPLP
jgi:hypothetical protein